jgi:hypothetical protein
LYPTADHIIPFREFWAFYEAINANCARERLDLFRAIATALSCAFTKKESGMLPELRSELEAAYLAAPDPAER